MFQLPRDLRESDGLVVALFPWSISVDAFEKHSWTQPRSVLCRETSPLDENYDTLSKDSHHDLYNRGLRILRFPKPLYDFMSQPDMKYCIWHEKDGGPNTPGLETRCLETILRRCGSEDVGHKKDLRVIFVHVGSIDSLHKIGALAARRAKRAEIRFFSYGSCNSVPPERWGVREIYPIGKLCR